MKIPVQSFRMHQTPADVAFNAMAARMYPGPQPAIQFGRRGVGGLGFSCPPGWTPCTNENGDNICLYPGNSCGNAPQPTNGPVCQDFATWTAQVPGNDCSNMYPGSVPDQQCQAGNAVHQAAIQQIQEAFGDCFPPGAYVSIDNSTGYWSVTQNGNTLFSGNAGGGNIQFGAAGQAGQNEVQPQNIGLPGTMSAPAAPSSAPNPVTIQPAPISQPVLQPVSLSPPVVATPTTITPPPVSTSPAASTAAPVSSQSAPQACSGINIGGTCIDTTILLVAGGLLAFVLLGGKR